MFILPWIRARLPRVNMRCGIYMELVKTGGEPGIVLLIARALAPCHWGDVSERCCTAMQAQRVGIGEAWTRSSPVPCPLRQNEVSADAILHSHRNAHMSGPMYPTLPNNRKVNDAVYR